MSTKNGSDERISTGLPGLDNILGGGLDPNRLYLVEGNHSRGTHVPVEEPSTASQAALFGGR